MARLIIIAFLLTACSTGEPNDTQDAGADAVLLDYQSDSAPGCDWVESSRSCINPTTIWVTASSRGCDDPEQDGLILSQDIACEQGETCIKYDSGVRCGR